MSIKELSSWDFCDTTHVPDGYDMRSIPSPTPANMEILMGKVNELIHEANLNSTMLDAMFPQRQDKD